MCTKIGMARASAFSSAHQRVPAIPPNQLINHPHPCLPWLPWLSHVLSSILPLPPHATPHQHPSTSASRDQLDSDESSDDGGNPKVDDDAAAMAEAFLKTSGLGAGMAPAQPQGHGTHRLSATEGDKVYTVGDRVKLINLKSSHNEKVGTVGPSVAATTTSPRLTPPIASASSRPLPLTALSATVRSRQCRAPPRVHLRSAPAAYPLPPYPL